MNETTLLSIKEFSDFTNVAQSTLRYYDDIGLLHPTKRGDNNYRYYTPFQIFKLNYINVLVDLGVPLATIKEMNLNRTPESVIELIDRQETILNQRLHDIQTAYAIIHTYRRTIRHGAAAHDGLIRVEELDEMPYISGPPNALQGNETFYDGFMRFCKMADTYRINLRYPIGGYFANMDRFLTSDGFPDGFFSVDPEGVKRRPSGKYLVGYHRGYYGDFGDLPQNMKAFADQHGIRYSGDIGVIYLLDEITTTSHDDYLLQASVRIHDKNINTPKRKKTSGFSTPTAE